VSGGCAQSVENGSGFATRLLGLYGRGHPHVEAVRTLVVTYPVGYALGIMDAVLLALADPSRRTVLEILRSHPATAGELAAALPIARPGVSRHLRVLREVGLVDVRQDAQRRIYSLRPDALAEVDEWLEPYRALWRNRLDALHTEIARGKKERK
jgi:DNA-binding transcriptional ArsR family regulator